MWKTKGKTLVECRKTSDEVLEESTTKISYPIQYQLLKNSRNIRYGPKGIYYTAEVSWGYSDCEALTQPQLEGNGKVF